MRKRTTVLVLCASLLAAGSSLTGCASTGVKKAEKATNTMQTVETEYRQLAAQTDATNASLRNLTNPGQTDLKKAFDTYKDNVDQMEKQANKLAKDRENMQAQGQDYFSEWGKVGTTYTNPEIQKLSEQRRLQLREQFAQIPQASVGVKTALNTYLNDIRDIRKFLSNDLTPKGIQAVDQIAQKALREGENLKSSVNPVLAAIQNARTAMRPGGSTGSAAGGPQQQQQQMEQQQMQPQQQQQW